MNEPWKLKESHERKKDELITFIIFCEDKVSEPVYLKYFETPKIKINFAVDKNNMMRNVLDAITHCKENGLLKCDGEDCRLDDENTQVWCVFDRDKEVVPEKVNRGNIEFDESIKTAKRNGINVAWSNDSFELWVLLHFEDVKTNDEYKHREKYYNRLTEIFNSIENTNEDLKKVKRYPKWSYKNSLKSENNFRNIVRNEIIANVHPAIKRAKNLEQYFEKPEFQNHEKSPCTMMHHLVEELLIKGGKSINIREKGV